MFITEKALFTSVWEYLRLILFQTGARWISLYWERLKKKEEFVTVTAVGPRIIYCYCVIVDSMLCVLFEVQSSV